MLDALNGMGFFAWSYSTKGLPAHCSPHINKAFPIIKTDPPTLVQLRQRRQLSAKLADITYRYIESGLPVLLATKDHALVAIGHTYDPGATASVAIQRIPEFIVHNDAAGPYRRMCLFGESPALLAFPDEGQLLPFSDVEAVIAVVPREVTLRGEDAEARAVICVEELLSKKINDLEYPTVRDLFQSYRPEFKLALSNLEYRTFLMPSVEFQAKLRNDIKNNRFDLELGNKMLQLDYPRFVWISEISSSSLLNRFDREQRCCWGRVIIDSTAPTKGQMVVHFCDSVTIIDRQHAAQELQMMIPNSTPFGHKIAP